MYALSRLVLSTLARDCECLHPNPTRVRVVCALVAMMLTTAIPEHNKMKE